MQNNNMLDQNDRNPLCLLDKAFPGNHDYEIAKELRPLFGSLSGVDA
jgi:predicted nucleic acid binding AN1-type Zn finger protein